MSGSLSTLFEARRCFRRILFRRTSPVPDQRANMFRLLMRLALHRKQMHAMTTQDPNQRAGWMDVQRVGVVDVEVVVIRLGPSDPGRFGQ